MLTRVCFITILSLCGFAATSQAQMRHGHMHGADGHGHNQATMPGLRGGNATEEESAELAILFRNFRTLSREVEDLENGIRTVTRSSDPDVMAALVSHSIGMMERVARKDDPKIFIQSPTLDIFLARGDMIETQAEVTSEGLVIVQTSNDPEVVESLQIHAAEVSAMVEQGMHAVHMMMMMKRAGN